MPPSPLPVAAAAAKSVKAVTIVAAANNCGVIGKNGKIPWSIPEDMQFLSQVTSRTRVAEKMNAVVMGRKTYESLPEKYKPLPGRLNIVLTRQPSDDKTSALVCHVSSYEAALDAAFSNDKIESVFLLGGSATYEAGLRHATTNRILLTRVGLQVEEADTFFPMIDDKDYKLIALAKTKAHGTKPFGLEVYHRRLNITEECDTARQTTNEDNSLRSTLNLFRDPAHKEGNREEPAANSKKVALCCPFLKERGHEELQYLDLVADIINDGNRENDRTGVGTLAKYGASMRFGLSQTFPLLTTKRVFWKGVVEELLWFIRGDTNAASLSSKGVKIWDANGSRDFLDSRGLRDREIGDLGPIYGFQWRHFGATYTNMHADYKEKGVDQLRQCIEQLKTPGADRRVVLSAWNPADVDKMALPPCHMFCQFFVVEDGTRLSCLMYQRSADMGLGVPFNIASYSLLALMMAQVCNLKPGEFIHVLGNAHVYLNHVAALKEQLLRTPRPFPVVTLNPDIKNIDSFQASDIELHNYHPHSKIAMEFAV